MSNASIGHVARQASSLGNALAEHWLFAGCDAFAYSSHSGQWHPYPARYGSVLDLWAQAQIQAQIWYVSGYWSVSGSIRVWVCFGVWLGARIHQTPP